MLRLATVASAWWPAVRFRGPRSTPQISKTRVSLCLAGRKQESFTQVNFTAERSGHVAQTPQTPGLLVI
jgi:hypothetical protein